jgi:hypothetical protein
MASTVQYMAGKCPRRDCGLPPVSSSQRASIAAKRGANLNMYWTGSVGRMGGRNGIFGAGWSGLILLAGVALLAPEAAYAGKLGQALGSAAGSVGGTAVGGVSAEATRQALAAKGMTEDDFFRMLFARGIPRAKQDLPKMVDAETEFYDVTGSGREWGYWPFTTIASWSTESLWISSTTDSPISIWKVTIAARCAALIWLMS